MAARSVYVVLIGAPGALKIDGVYASVTVAAKGFVKALSKTVGPLGMDQEGEVYSAAVKALKGGNDAWVEGPKSHVVAQRFPVSSTVAKANPRRRRSRRR